MCPARPARDINYSMGNDGGTIARGKDLKAIYGGASGTQAQQYLQKSHNSRVVTCAASSLPLYQNGAQTIVADCMGKVYLKDKVLEAMLEKRLHAGPRRLADLVDLNVTWKDAVATCPHSGTSTGLVYLRQCGCVFSPKMAGDSGDLGVCPTCGHEAESVDVVYLNPAENSEGQKLNAENYAVLGQRGLTHSKTPAKRKKKDVKGSKRHKAVDAGKNGVPGEKREEPTQESLEKQSRTEEFEKSGRDDNSEVKPKEGQEVKPNERPEVKLNEDPETCAETCSETPL